ncbi:hypothetical protein [Frigidibacter sp. ROC022]|uniref:hypothetical protein n=1 Tax=Frigidibacter sp. ROC022 TaxID=2971796 RepID=UPI00215A8352|nr:hypothetical protein [Frigidibacter sp. ROC022]MCR8724195.1 hypothetical protein [Frigidibacter sp. ROC022]
MFLDPLSRSATALVLSLALALPAAAGDGSLRQLDLSAQLYARGIADGDPLLVLAAAKLRKGLSFTPAPRDTKTPAADAAAPAPITWDEMLDSARELAAGDPALLGLIEDVAAESAKGVTTGQVYSISRIDDGGEDVYDNLPFAAGEYAEVYVESADGSDLNLYVYDAAGRLVCSDTDISAISYCGWRPSEGGAFTIRVENRGQGDAGYSLMTN